MLGNNSASRLPRRCCTFPALALLRQENAAAAVPPTLSLLLKKISSKVHKQAKQLRVLPTSGASGSLSARRLAPFGKMV